MTAADGGDARPLVPAPSAIYTTAMLVMIVVALRFVYPTQLVAQVKETRDD